MFGDLGGVPERLGRAEVTWGLDLSAGVTWGLDLSAVVTWVRVMSEEGLLLDFYTTRNHAHFLFNQKNHLDAVNRQIASKATTRNQST